MSGAVVRESAVRLAILAPELLGTYGDWGNAVVLAKRLEWRGIPVETVAVTDGAAPPDDADLYVLGGGEDAPQTLAAHRLDAAGFPSVVERGAAVFAVCAGLQILGRSYTGADGTSVDGLGMLDCTTTPRGHRLIGELVVEPTIADIPVLTGFENHGGVTAIGPDAAPLGRVAVGAGNGTGGVEGVHQGRVVGTYLHGPGLARNPELADLLLSWIVGPLEPLDDTVVDRLRAERLEEARRGRAPVAVL